MRGRAPFFGAALFLCPADPAHRADSRIPVCDPAAGIAPPQALARESGLRAVLVNPGAWPCRASYSGSSERTHLAILPRVCGRRCLRSRSCVCPSNQSRASARCSLELRVRSAFRIYVAVDSWGGAQAGLREGREPVWVKSVSQLVICALSTYACI